MGELTAEMNPSTVLVCLVCSIVLVLSMVREDCAVSPGCSGTLSGCYRGLLSFRQLSVKGGITGCESVSGVAVPVSSSLSSLSSPVSLADLLVSWAQELGQKCALCSTDLDVTSHRIGTVGSQMSGTITVKTTQKHGRHWHNGWVDYSDDMYGVVLRSTDESESSQIAGNSVSRI